MPKIPERLDNLYERGVALKHTLAEPGRGRGSRLCAKLSSLARSAWHVG